MEKAKVQGNRLQYRKGFKTVEVPAEDIVWGYLQVEDVKATLCCGRFDTEIGRAIFVEKSGEKHVIQYEGTKKAKELIDKVKNANQDMAVGYNEENKQKYL